MNPRLENIRVCNFCGFKFPAANSTSVGEAEPAWRGEVAQRLASYRARRRRSDPGGQPELPFEQLAEVSPAVPAVAVSEPPAVADDFSFTIAIGRAASRRPCDDPQMYIDVSLAPETPDAKNLNSDGSTQQDTQHSGLYPVASIEERRLSGLIDAGCLLVPWGSFLALFGSLGGHFAFSKLSAVVFLASFAMVYVQYFALFTVFGGTTPGMMLRGLRVVDFSGEDPSPRQLLIRAAGYMLSAGSFFLGFLWSQWDEDELTWHDRISHTYLSSAHTVADTELGAAVHGH